MRPLSCLPRCHPWLLDPLPLWLLCRESNYDKCQSIFICCGSHVGSSRTYLQLFNHGGAFHLDLGNRASIWRLPLQNKMKHEKVTVKWVQKRKYSEGGKLGREKQKVLVGEQMKSYMMFLCKSLLSSFLTMPSFCSLAILGFCIHVSFLWERRWLSTFWLKYLS